MILTVCLNPCIDKNLYFDTVSLHALNRANKCTVSLSGKGINVAIALSRLKAKSFSTGFMYKDDAEKYYKRLEKESTPYEFIECEGATRVNIKVIEENGSLTEFNESGLSVNSSQLQELFDLFENLSKKADTVIFSGSVPKGAGEDIYLKLGIKIPKGVRIIVDSELNALKNTFLLKPALIKPNLFELNQLTRKDCKSDFDILRACDSVLEMGVGCILCSKGKEGAIIYDGKSAYSAISPEIKVLSSVGAGDSMLAAAAKAMTEGQTLKDILVSAVSAGSAACMTEGTELFFPQDYSILLNRINVTRLF